MSARHPVILGPSTNPADSCQCPEPEVGHSPPATTFLSSSGQMDGGRYEVEESITQLSLNTSWVLPLRPPKVLKKVRTPRFQNHQLPRPPNVDLAWLPVYVVKSSHSSWDH